jgi:hypothetical protein
MRAELSGIGIPVGARDFFCFGNSPDPIWEPASCSVGTEAKAPGRSVQYSPSCSAEIKRKYKYVFILPVYVYIA